MEKEKRRLRRNCLFKRLSTEDLVKIRAEQRKAAYRAGKPLRGIGLRKKFHFLVAFILKADQLLSREKIVILADRHDQKSKAPKIFACTHIGGNDIQRTFQVIRAPAWLMLGDPGILYRKLIYQGLRMNGVIPLETTDPEDRKNAYQRSIELLQHGGNLLIYPEGAWNVSPNEVVMKLFTGTVRMARETGAEIVPIAVEQYGKTFYFNIGVGYTIPKDAVQSADELTGQLRDILATLKWDIMLTQAPLSRAELPEDYLGQFQDEIVGRCNYGYGFSLEDALKERFHDKSIADEAEVFAFLKTLEIDQRNAFLARVREDLPTT